MSIEINSINQNTANNNKIIAFKSKPMPNDKVELSKGANVSPHPNSPRQGKKLPPITGRTEEGYENSSVKNICIGAGVVTLIGLGIELIWGKGKHLKKLWEKISGKKSHKKPDSKPKITGTKDLPQIADFKNMNEAKEYFESIGVKTVFKSGSEKHLSDLNKIKDDLVILEKNGVAIPKPESIIINDWHNKDELKQILQEMNIRETIADFCNSNTWAWGTVAKGVDNRCHVIINSSFSGDYGKFIHEMGHIHQDYLKSSYWHTKGLSDKEFLNKQIEILGLSDVGLHDDGINMIIRDFGLEDTPSILRGYTSSNASSSVKAKLKQMFPNINNDSDYEKLFTILGKDGKTYVINAKKMVDKMYSESGVYAPSKSWENVAEIFQGLNKGKEYSDLVMLMYDICGGGRVPNIYIKGKKYDDYIESLYNNPDLIRQLRECIEVKELV